MIVASIYLGCIVALAVLLPFAPLRSNESTAEWDVFRYPKIAVSSLRVGAVVFALVGVCIYHTFQHPGVLDAVVVNGIFGSMSLVLLAMIVQVSAFSVAISKQCLKLIGWRRCRSIDFNSVRKVVVVWPWRRGGRLDLIDRDGKKLCRIDSGLRDFEGIVSLVKLHCPDSVTIREKDTRGHWTELTR